MITDVVYPKLAKWSGQLFDNLILKMGLKKLSHTALTWLMVGLFSSVGLSGCQNQSQSRSPLREAAQPVVVPTITTTFPASKDSKPLPQSEQTIQEVDPPESIQQLRQATAAIRPQLSIIRPQPGEILKETATSVVLDLRGFKIFQDSTSGLGPHLHLLLDDRVEQDIYSLDTPLNLNDLEPGTHTLRVFAVQPWGESFKTAGAYAQVTFHVLAPDGHYQPSASLPLLTYNLPQGRYTTEPILLDFVLQNAPLHLVAQEKADDEISDWRIRCTINGQSFVLDRWQSLYLEGFEPGNNWIRLEFLNESGEPIANTFNTTVRLVNYQPDADRENDPLGQLIQGKFSLDELQRIIDPTGQTKIPPLPQPDGSKPEQQNQADSERSEPKPSEPESASKKAQPEPDQPTPSQTNSDQPEPETKPEQSEPNQPEPTRSELNQPEPDRPKPDQIEPNSPKPSPTESSQQEADQPAPTEPSQPEQTQSKPDPAKSIETETSDGVSDVASDAANDETSDTKAPTVQPTETEGEPSEPTKGNKSAEAKNPEKTPSPSGSGREQQPATSENSANSTPSDTIAPKPNKTESGTAPGLEESASDRETSPAEAKPELETSPTQKSDSQRPGTKPLPDQSAQLQPSQSIEASTQPESEPKIE